MDKSFRINTKIGSDNVIRVNLRQDIDTFNILSLNINADTGYKTFTANYGIIVGRVVGNGGIGIPNAKVSVFIPLSQTDEKNPNIVTLYPFKTVTDIDSDGRRYNLLPATYHDTTHVAVGTFPTAQMVLDNDICLEIYEKYYKLSTVTNNSGDYMITNVPVGTQTLHMDVDISDIGYLSQKPYDLLYKGYDKSMFESALKFKGGTNLDLLPQIYSQNETLTVYPFWGDESSNEIAITRKDFKLQYEFQPTAVFLGSSFTDQDSNYVSPECTISDKCGDASQLKASRGNITIMRETYDGRLEEFSSNSVDQIDGNGIWCMQIPMNLDYITTNEEGEIVRTNDTTKGIPTRARVRFKITLDGDEEDASTSHALTYFVPSNIENEENIDGYEIHSPITEKAFDSLVKKMTYWGNDPDIADDSFRKTCMRDVLWNCVYSVKNYIPRLQVVNGTNSLTTVKGANHIGLKGVNKKAAQWENPLPYNKMNLDLSYDVWNSIQSLWSSMSQWYNRRTSTPGLMKHLYNDTLWQRSSWMGRYFRFFGYSRPFFFNFRTYESVASEDEIMANTLELYDGVSYDFYNDWLNGSLYFPKVKFDHNDNDNICACNNGTNKANFYFNDSCSLDYHINSSTKKLGLHYKTNRCIMWSSIFGKGGKIDDVNWNKVEEGNNGVNNYNSHTANVKLKNGFIYQNVSKNDENNITYAYSPLLFGNAQNKGDKIYPGFRTDLILLGAIDDYNILGIPSVRNLKLPKTTSKIIHMYRAETPFNPEENTSSSQAVLAPHGNAKGGDILEGQELSIGDDEQYNYDTADDAGLDNGRSYNVTGAFWGTAEYTPWYVYTYRWYRWWGGWWSRWWLKWALRPTLISSQSFFTDMRGSNYKERDMGMHTLLGQGLFFGRSAFSMFSNTYVTKPKTCVNLSRICELSVTNEDSLSYLGNIYGNWVNADTIGVITDEQITTPLSRTLFATLNGKTLNVKNDSSSLPKYDLRYRPINGFDGFLDYMVLKESKVATTTYTELRESKSDEYIDFRYGNYDNAKQRDNRKFNYIFNEGHSDTSQQSNPTDWEGYRFPITDNSFYFYFGIDPSHTAIDKFNELYS